MDNEHVIFSLINTCIKTIKERKENFLFCFYTITANGPFLDKKENDMKYNVGDKFVIEIEQKIEEAGLYKIKGFKSLVFDDYGLNQIGQMVRGVDQFAYNKGLEDAWKIATMIYKSSYHDGLKGFEVKKYFGCTIDEIHKLPIQEVVKGFRRYEEDQNLDWSKVPVDAPILVRRSKENEWVPRHFAMYKDGRVYAWADSRTSYTSEVPVYWEMAKLPEEE